MDGYRICLHCHCFLTLNDWTWLKREENIIFCCQREKTLYCCLPRKGIVRMNKTRTRSSHPWQEYQMDGSEEIISHPLMSQKKAYKYSCEWRRWPGWIYFIHCKSFYGFHSCDFLHQELQSNGVEAITVLCVLSQQVYLWFELLLNA